MKPIVVIPTYNEKENVEAMAQAVLAVLPPEGKLLFLDDNSPDGTGEIIDSICVREPRVAVMHRQKKEGLGRAYVAGFAEALKMGATHVVEMDCDFSHDPKDLQRMFATVKGGMSNKSGQWSVVSGQNDGASNKSGQWSVVSGQNGSGQSSVGRGQKSSEQEISGTADVVVGSRYVRGGRCVGWPFKRWFISFFGGRFIRFMLGVPVQDPTGGFKCFTREALEKLGDFSMIKSFGYSFQMEMNYRMAKMGLKLQEIPITFTERRAGTSKISGSIATETLKMVFRLRFGKM